MSSRSSTDDGTLVGVLTSELDDVYEQAGGLVEAGASLDAASERLEAAAAASEASA